MAPVLKTGIVHKNNYRGFESLSLLLLDEYIFFFIGFFYFLASEIKESGSAG